MTKDEIQKLYKETILPEYRKPYHFDKISNPIEVVRAYNPICGDKFDLYINSDNPRKFYFHGIGCAISKASTSILMRKIEGLNKTDQVDLCAKFIDSLIDGDPKELHDKELEL